LFCIIEKPLDLRYPPAPPPWRRQGHVGQIEKTRIFGVGCMHLAAGVR